MTEVEKTYLSISKEEWNELNNLFSRHYDIFFHLMLKLSETCPHGTFRATTPFGYIIFKTG